MRGVLVTLGMIVPVVVVLSSCGGGSKGGGNDGGGSGGTGGEVEGGAEDAGGPVPGSYAQIKAILSSHNCGFCHAGGGSTLPSSMNLEGDPLAALVGVDSEECAAMGGRKRVNPGMPGSSYLLDKLKGMNLCGGVRMPMTGPPLSSSELGLIEGWIASGASAD